MNFFCYLIFLFPLTLNANLNNNSHCHHSTFQRPVLSKTVPFLSHSGEGRFSSYLTMNLPYNSFKPTFITLNKMVHGDLITRGEAHVTVITPIEYFDVLKKHLTIDDINEIAKNLKIQKSKMNFICLGRGQKEINNQIESTYFIVVESENLLEIRRAVHKAYISKGGNATDFNPNHYFPHVTIGFSQRDLHENDGVFKDKRSCWMSFEN